MVRLTVHVTPRSARDAVDGWRGEALCVRVTAPPEDGKANAAVEKAIASGLRVPKSSVRVVRGHTARTKQVEVDGVDEEDVRAAFGSPGETLF